MNKVEDELGPGGRYTAPALEKGLDILELLAGRAGAMAGSEIAQALGRSPGELFRMLVALERRGYIRRDATGSFALTLKLFELAQWHPPTERLIAVALPRMRDLAAMIGQPCHLAVPDDGRLIVLCRVESPRPWGLAVRVGAPYALTRHASGRVLLAFQSPQVRLAWLARARIHEGAEYVPELGEALEAIARDGFEAGPSDAVSGAVTLSAPILDSSGRAFAALTVPFLLMRGNRFDPQSAMPHVLEAASAIAVELGAPALKTGGLPSPRRLRPSARAARPRR
jgi:DNA-binding IclR family transcriptional regulator